MANAAPPLETDRLTLGGHGRTDFTECAALWGDAAVVRFIGTGRPLDGEEVWSRLLRYVGHWSLMGYGYWCVREKTTGRFVGDVGFANLRRIMQPGLGDAPEIGWVLNSWAQGRGLAAEAVAAVLAWSDAHLAAPETVCIIRPDHQRSIRFAERAGFRRMGQALYRDNPINIFARARVFPSAP